MKKERISIMAAIMWEIIAIAIFAVVISLTFFIFEKGTWVWYTLIGLEGGILILITFLYIPFLYVNTLFYINDTAIILHKGVIFPSTQILYRDRIAFVTIYKNPLTPLLHVSTLRITAAGGNMTILFLNSVRAKKLSQELLKDIEDDIEINN